jgi:hypothetical protein
MDEHMDPLIPGDEELRRRLAAYADAALRPDPLATARARARVMAVARSRPEPQVSSAVPAGHRRPSRRWRPVFGLLAASLVLVVVVGGAAAASGPGGILYGARLWLEQVTLPTDASARADAELRRMQARLDEVQVAAAAGDEGALAAALVAYAEAADAALADLPAGSDPNRLETVLARHLAVLDGLLTTAPDAAIKGLQNAIENSGKVIDRIHEGTPAASPKASDKPENSPAASPKASDKPEHSPAASPKASSKP